ncbi:hypothetical protein ACSSS7_004007 [Eimeria intestinalis]
MADTTLETHGSANPDSPLSWMPHVLFPLSFLLGICCLFFMSSGGIVLCILHCVIGTLAALVTWGTRTKNHQIMAMVAVLLNFLYWLLLICTLVYTAWLLSQHVKAKRDYNKGVSSPALGPMLEQYSEYVSAEDGADGPVRRLQSVTMPFSRFIQTSVAQLRHDEKESYYSPVVLRQGATPTKVSDLKLSEAETKCMTKLSTDEELRKKVNSRVETFVDYGLFCGYTKYKAGSMSKWPIDCNEDCLLDKLHFSNIRKNTEKSQRQSEEFKAALHTMGKEKAKMCGMLTLVTACRMEEKHFPQGTIAALSFAIIFTVALLFLSAACLVACFKVIGKDRNKRVVVTAN